MEQPKRYILIGFNVNNMNIDIMGSFSERKCAQQLLSKLYDRDNASIMKNFMKCKEDLVTLIEERTREPKVSEKEDKNTRSTRKRKNVSTTIQEEAQIVCSLKILKHSVKHLPVPCNPDRLDRLKVLSITTKLDHEDPIFISWQNFLLRLRDAENCMAGNVGDICLEILDILDTKYQVEESGSFKIRRHSTVSIDDSDEEVKVQ